MKSTLNLSFTDGQQSTGDLIFQKFSAKLIEERNERRRKIIYGTACVVFVLMAVTLVMG